MATDMDKKLKDLQEIIAKKSAELKELRKLERAYYIASKMEQKILPKNASATDTAAKVSE